MACKTSKDKSIEEIGLDDVPIYSPIEGARIHDALGAAPSLRAVLYATGRLSNLGYVRALPHLTHIRAGHGDSAKHSNSSRISIAYDYVLVADNNSILRYVEAGTDIPPDKFLPIGGAVIEGASVDRHGGTGAGNILYAPTWEGHSGRVNFSSAGRATDALLHAAESHPFRFAPHRSLGSKTPEIANVRKKFETAMGTSASKAEAFNWADVLVSDVSGVISEFLFTRKPIIIPIGDDWIADYVRGTELAKFTYLWDFKNTSFDQQLETVARDPLRDARLRQADRLFAGVESMDESAQLFDDALDYAALNTDFKLRRAGVAPARGNGVPRPKTLPRRLAKVASDVAAGKAILGA